ncbi:MAG: PrsW family glutamic-type intramembrane protease [Acidobacteriota bacterium]
MPINVATALLPVLVFLAVLYLMDSFKLLSFGTIGAAMCAGAVVALAALALHSWLLPASGLSTRQFSRYIAPITEESLKALYVVVVLRQRRLGFLVDAALVGFAVGTGFALVENADYLRKVGDGPLILWLVRGFGPAVLHGAMTALFAILAKSLSDRHPTRGALALLPALGAAVVFHSTFNHFPMPPILATCVLLIVLPIVVSFVFDRSEQATREWVGQGLDLDVELLNLIRSADFGGTRLGSYLIQLRERFPGPVVADMFCLLQVELELGIRAKGMLMARDAGLDVPPAPDLKPRLQERRYLQHSIGPTGLLALAPLRSAGNRDDWHSYLLEQAGEESGDAWHRGWQAVRRRFKR